MINKQSQKSLHEKFGSQKWHGNGGLHYYIELLLVYSVVDGLLFEIVTMEGYNGADN